MNSLRFEHRAVQSGLTEPVVRDVVLSFYEKVRRDVVLGPIFEDSIGHDWDHHIERIISFWLTATRLRREYDGRSFMPAHARHRSIMVEHIPRWLKLFGETASEQCTPEVASVLVDIAERMAETLAISLAKRDQQ